MDFINGTLPAVPDPRPELDHSTLVQIVLSVSRNRDLKLYGILSGFRAGGAVFTANSSQVELRPPSNLGSQWPDNYLWSNKSEYLEARHKWLVPKADKIKEIFNEAESLGIA